MQAAAEISMYPLDADYIPPIEEFIRRLNRHEGLTVRTNALSTQLFGPYDQLMAVLTAEVKRTFQEPRKVVMVVKLLNADVQP